MPSQNPVLAPPATDRPPVALPTAAVVGTDLAATDYAQVMAWMDDTIARGGRACLTAAAVNLVMSAREDPEVRAAVDRALAVPDGQPLVWALRALGHAGATRVYGPDLMAKYCERSAATGVRMYLYGGRNEGALVQLTLELRRRYPGLRIVGGYSPPFRPLSAAEERRVVEDINRSGADVVWVGIGQPKQERWMAEMRDRLHAPVLVGVGAAFDFHAGLVRQAPSWLQRLGLEWLFRLSQEPRRLWRRYLRYNPLFVLGFARQYLGVRRARARR
jgi:N-acetylglucosaminyldiphosphoundecaprenol N-acetyl-beta-D-mannosaminyltransferase